MMALVGLRKSQRRRKRKKGLEICSYLEGVRSFELDNKEHE
jgi:hypothetical protein